MKMKNIYQLLVLLALFITACNAGPKDKPQKKEQPALYNLPLPKGWTKEVFPIPISFAPEINYKGHEEIRFAPGWADSSKADYWSYAFVWCLDADPGLTDSIIASNLRYYYNGLVRANSRQFHISNAKLNTTQTAFEKIPPGKEELQAYRGSISMTDYMKGTTQVLHALVHVKYCSTVSKFIVFHGISPQPFTHSIWNSLEDIWLGFTCGKPLQ